ncbi:MAG: hypothetical protein QXH07_05825, partial [Thermoplasmata archaeon]
MKVGSISILVFALFLLAYAIPSVSAQTPSGTLYYSNITIGSWSGASSQYVQQKITLNLSNYA